MTVQPPLPLAPDGASIEIGQVVALVEDADGGRVFLRGELVWAWDAGDTATRCLAAVQLWRVKAARLGQIAAGFGVDPSTVRRWGYEVAESGAGGLVPARRGPKGPSRLSDAVVADIRARRRAGQSQQGIADAVGVSASSVRRALADPPTATVTDDHADADAES